MNNQRRQNNGQRIKIVRDYCASLKDQKQLIVCFLLSREVPEKEICKFLKIRQNRLNLIKMQIAIGLRHAGIRLRGEEA